MKTVIHALVALAAAVTLISGCMPDMDQIMNERIANNERLMRRMNPDMDKQQRDVELFQKRMSLGQKFQSNPDTDAWHEHRQKIAQAMGDRVFDKDFARVFDSLTLAVSTMELKVSNMERQSGYISASGISLPPAESKAMRREAKNDWCRQNGVDPSILDQPFETSAWQNRSGIPDIGEMMGKYDKTQKSLTFQLVKMSKSQTKVKLRFSDVYYPGEVEAHYKLVWQAVDKQIFIDQNMEDAVEKRE